MLVCPKCSEKLKKVNNSYKCKNNHCFDIAKSGYTNLLLKTSKTSGDNAKMVEARRAFLATDAYLPLADYLATVLNKLNLDLVVDAGCGEGYYTNLLASINRNTHFLGFDMSKQTLKKASKKQNDNTNYFLASLFNLPLASASVDGILNIFAPAASGEFKRILKKEGYLIKVDPGPRHLYEMKTLLYDEVYENKLKYLKDWNLVYEKLLTYQIDVDNGQLNNLLMMTPYAYKTSLKAIDKLKNIDKLNLTVSFNIAFYQK